MRGRKVLLALGALVLVGVGGYGVAPAQSDQHPPPILVESVTGRATFPDKVDLQVRVKVPGEGTQVRNIDDPSHVVTAKLTVQPDARFPWHVHPGPVLVTVASGDLVYVDGEDCSERTYPTGTAFFDVGNHVHSAYNPSDPSDRSPTILYATWFDAPAVGPLTIPVDTPPCA